jgi:hypothetical protein
LGESLLEEGLLGGHSGHTVRSFVTECRVEEDELIVESGGVPPEAALRSAPATHCETRDEGTEVARFRAYSRRRESGSCGRSSDTSAPA